MTESGAGNLNPDIARLIDNYIEAYKQEVSARGKASVEYTQRLLDQQIRDAIQRADWLRLVDLPARGLTRQLTVPGLWSKLPESIRNDHIQKVKTWVDRAKEGDKVAQAVLLRSRSILEEKKVPTQGLPSFDWQESQK